MSAFPKLKTGAVAQYPASRALTYATEVLRFIDGSEQRFRMNGAPVRRWVVRLDLLDDTELAQVEALFRSMQGRFGSFSFQDPWDNTVHADCSFDSDELAMELDGEARARVWVTVRENRS